MLYDGQALIADAFAFNGTLSDIYWKLTLLYRDICCMVAVAPFLYGSKCECLPQPIWLVDFMKASALEWIPCSSFLIRFAESERARSIVLSLNACAWLEFHVSTNAPSCSMDPCECPHSPAIYGRSAVVVLWSGERLYRMWHLLQRFHTSSTAFRDPAQEQFSAGLA